MKDVIKRTQDMLDIVSNYRAEDMTMVFAKLSALKSALESADMFFEASVQFARLEAYALIRAVELSDGKKPALTGKNKVARASAGVWLYNMTESERNEIIEKCTDGKTVVSIYRELHCSSKEERILKLKKGITKELLEDLDFKGVCKINEYEKYFNRIDSSIRQDIKDGIRNTLLQKGAVGINDMQGTYIMPNKGGGKVLDALESRLVSICRDFSSFLFLASECECKPFFKVGNANSNIGMFEFLLLLASYKNSVSIMITPHAKKQLRKMLGDLLEIVEAQGRIAS